MGDGGFAYDPLGRLDKETVGVDARFAYDGLAAIAEYDLAGALRNRYVFVPGIDEPLVEYSAAGVRTWLMADERGSIVARASDAGTLLHVNTYDEYGVPASTNLGRFQYTGQMAFEPGYDLYHYKMRTYWSPGGRFLQADPIGYASGMNLYAYVGNDPINYIDRNGEIGNFIAGALVGAAISYAAQVTTNFQSGQTGFSALTNVNAEQIAVSGALGALGGGFLKASITGTARFIPLVGDPIRLNTGERLIVGAHALVAPAVTALVNQGYKKNTGSTLPGLSAITEPWLGGDAFFGDGSGRQTSGTGYYIVESDGWTYWINDQGQIIFKAPAEPTQGADDDAGQGT